MSEAKRIDGKAASERLRERIGEKVERLRESHKTQSGLGGCPG